MVVYIDTYVHEYAYPGMPGWLCMCLKNKGVIR